MFKFKKGLLSKWLIGIAGGYRSERIIRIRHLRKNLLNAPFPISPTAEISEINLEADIVRERKEADIYSLSSTYFTAQSSS